MLWLLTACDGEAPTAPPSAADGCAFTALSHVDPPQSSCPTDADAHADATPPELIVLFTMDATNRSYFGGRHPEWNVTPRIDAFLKEGAWFPNLLSVRGLTGVAMSSLLTGLYPRRNGVRNHDYDVASPEPSIAERLHDAGYRTAVFSDNQCWVVEDRVDELVCTWNDPNFPDQHDRDVPLIQAAVETLVNRKPGEKLFMWVHVLDAHDPYVDRPPYYEQFHPDPYDGDYQEGSIQLLGEAITGERGVNAEDQRQIEALYASQVRTVDDLFGALRDAVVASDPDAVMLLSTDHGEELGQHRGYYWHGCSPYNPVMASSLAIVAPDRVAAGAVRPGWVSSVDIAPTLLDLAGLPAVATLDGASLLPNLDACTDPERTVYFERSPDSAGLIQGETKAFYDPLGSFDDCSPFDQVESTYEDDVANVFDLDADPDECQNLAASQPERWTVLRSTLCDWVLQESWSEEEDNVLVAACREG
jgi:arylsulfatase A-like enzyme